MSGLIGPAAAAVAAGPSWNVLRHMVAVAVAAAAVEAAIVVAVVAVAAVALAAAAVSVAVPCFQLETRRIESELVLTPESMSWSGSSHQAANAGGCLPGTQPAEAPTCPAHHHRSLSSRSWD